MLRVDTTRGVTSIWDAPPKALLGTLAVIILFPPLLLIGTRLGGGGSAAQKAAEFDRQIETARRLLDAKRARESLVPLARAQRLQPNSFAVYNDECVAYGLLERKQEAVDACKRALSIEPSSALAENNLAWVQSIQEKAR
jgi:tetratricopeptide (TPR) repeat protein